MQMKYADQADPAMVVGRRRITPSRKTNPMKIVTSENAYVLRPLMTADQGAAYRRKTKDIIEITCLQSRD
jgi:hypothetical protein